MPGALLEKILAPNALTTLVQPIYDLGNNTVFAVECLTRGPQGSNLHRPDVLFEYARRKHEEAAVDRAAIRTAIASTVLPRGRISLNVHSATLERDLGFQSFLETTCAAAGVLPARIMLEIIEYRTAYDANRLQRAIEKLRARGIAIAIDDVGQHDSNYRIIVDTHPDFLKVDGYLVRGCAGDRYRRASIESLLVLADFIGAEVIAEGVEDARDIEVLQTTGIRLFQGYALCRPMPAGAASDNGYLDSRLTAAVAALSADKGRVVEMGAR